MKTLTFHVASLLLLSIPLNLLSASEAQGPAWWQEQNVINANATVDDYAAVNQGQLKTIATKAYQAITHRVGEGGINASLANLITNWQASPSADDYIAVNIGQAKYVSSLFYTQLNLPYPWANSTLTPNDYALVNIGQIKHLFSFDLSSLMNFRAGIDSDGNGLADAWEMQYFGYIGVDPLADANGNGLSNWQEYLLGNDPGETSQQGPYSLGLQIFLP